MAVQGEENLQQFLSQFEVSESLLDRFRQALDKKKSSRTASQRDRELRDILSAELARKPSQEEMKSQATLVSHKSQKSRERSSKGESSDRKEHSQTLLNWKKKLHD